MSTLRHEERTYQLRGLIFEVRNELRARWSEHIYHYALERNLRKHGVPVQSKPRRSLVHRNIEIHTFEPDLIVWDTIALELKVLPYQTEFASEHYAQLIHYLKFYGLDLGLLVNFAPNLTKIKRVVWNEPDSDVFEDFHLIEADLTDEESRCLERIRQCAISIAEQYGLGYSDAIYRSMLYAEFQHNDLSCRDRIDIPAKGFDTVLAYHSTSELLIAEGYPVYVCSLSHRPAEYDFMRMKTYVRNLNAKFGLVINFGHKYLQIFGVDNK